MGRASSACVHCGREVEGLFMLPSGDFYLCRGCYDRALDFVGDPTIHHWKTVQVEIGGLTADTTYVVERCRICGDLKVDEEARVVEWVGGEPIPDAERTAAADAAAEVDAAAEADADDTAADDDDVENDADEADAVPRWDRTVYRSSSTPQARGDR